MERMETLSGLARRRGVSLYTVVRAAKARGVRPAAVYGNVGVYDAAGVASIEERLDELASHRRQLEPAGAA